jgi:ubiquinone/menaquinone biosynthesis C-methylase UbiE
MNSTKLRQTYNKIAQQFAEDHSQDTWDDDYIKLFVTSLPKGADVLDLGCGAGNDANKLSEKGLTITGLDISDSFIAIAKAKYPKINFIRGDLLRTPFNQATFDGLFAKASLLHVAKKDMPRALAEIKRIVKPKGVIHLALKGGEGEGEITENDYGYDYTRFFSYWKMEQLVDILEKARFGIKKKDVWRKSENSYTIWLKLLVVNL